MLDGIRLVIEITLNGAATQIGISYLVLDHEAATMSGESCTVKWSDTTAALCFNSDISRKFNLEFSITLFGICFRTIRLDSAGNRSVCVAIDNIVRGATE